MNRVQTLLKLKTTARIPRFRRFWAEAIIFTSLVYHNLFSPLQESIEEDEVTVIDADDSPVVIAKDADNSLRAIFPVFESGLRSIDQPIRFLRPDQVWVRPLC